MATNPMQRKAKNSFLLGFLLMLLIAAIAVGFLLLQLVQSRKEMESLKATQKSTYALKQDIASGTPITTELLTPVTSDSRAIPTDAITPATIAAIPEGSTATARINLTKGTILTANMITTPEGQYANDLRLQEYNMLVLPSQLKSQEYIDIRLRMPTGADYIVVTKKMVEIPQIAGVDSQDSIWLKMTEDEILMLSNAIVEAYITDGSYLYVTRYTEPGMQAAATPTYLPNNDVIRLMEQDPNITTEAKNALFTRNNSTRGVIRDNGISAIVNSQENGSDNLVKGVTEEINKSKEERQKYLEDLGGY